MNASVGFCAKKKDIEKHKKLVQSTAGRGRVNVCCMGGFGWKLFTVKGQYSKFKKAIHEQAKKISKHNV